MAQPSVGTGEVVIGEPTPEELAEIRRLHTEHMKLLHARQEYKHMIDNASQEFRQTYCQMQRMQQEIRSLWVQILAVGQTFQNHDSQVYNPHGTVQTATHSHLLMPPGSSPRAGLGVAWEGNEVTQQTPTATSGESVPTIHNVSMGRPFIADQQFSQPTESIPGDPRRFDNAVERVGLPNARGPA